MTQAKEKLKDRVWSYSSLSLYEKCPHAFYQRYIANIKGEDNAFAQWGKMMHGLLELNAKGKLPCDKMLGEYEKRFVEEITEEFPVTYRGQDLAEVYYRAGIGYLFQYDGIPDKYDVLAVEQKFILDMGGFKFTGVPDLVLKDKITGALILVDHKSRAKFASKKELREATRQLYLYSAWIKQKYGNYPAWLVFNLMRAEKPLLIPFDAEAYAEAMAWANATVSQALADDSFEYEMNRRRVRGAYSVPGYCSNICNYRFECEAKW